jgi:two-component system, NarL family, response regulator LiaR
MEDKIARKYTGPDGTSPAFAASERIKTVIVEDDAETRATLTEIVEDSAGYDCLGGYATGAEAIPEILRLNPHLVLMDIRLPGISGIECTRRLKRILPELIVVLVTGRLDPATIADAFAAGGDSYLMKPFTVAQCVATLNFASQRHLARVHRARQRPIVLTLREHEIIRCFANGMLYKEIAAELGISYSAVHKHQHNLFVKLRVQNRSEAIQKWRELGGI